MLDFTPDSTWVAASHRIIAAVAPVAFARARGSAPLAAYLENVRGYGDGGTTIYIQEVNHESRAQL